MRNKLFFGFIFIALVIFLVIGVSSVENSNLSVTKGKNNVSFEKGQEFFVSTLINLNPNIESVSYIDSEGKSHGYVNFAGGMGENFMIDSSKNYEIVSKENVNLELP